MKLPIPSVPTALRIACIAALIALSLMVWSFLDPSPMAMVIAMSVGQGIGTMSLVLFAGVVAFDLFKNRGSRRE